MKLIPLFLIALVSVCCNSIDTNSEPEGYVLHKTPGLNYKLKLPPEFKYVELETFMNTLKSAATPQQLEHWINPSQVVNQNFAYGVFADTNNYNNHLSYCEGEYIRFNPQIAKKWMEMNRASFEKLQSKLNREFWLADSKYSIRKPFTIIKTSYKIKYVDSDTSMQTSYLISNSQKRQTFVIEVAGANGFDLENSVMNIK